MKMFYVAAIGLIGLTALGCACESPLAPLPPPAPNLEPRPDPPPASPPGALRIEVGAVTSDWLLNWPLPLTCPIDANAAEGRMPCRVFEVVAPGDGVLRVEALFVANYGAETGVRLNIAGVDQPFNYFNQPTTGTHRVLAGATYGITVVYAPSHYDYLWDGPQLIGELKMTPTFIPQTWR